MAARHFRPVGRILRDALDTHDFEGFDLRTCSPFSEHGLQRVDPARELRWTKRGMLITPEIGNVWSITLKLVSSRARHCGNLTVFRHYSNRDLQLDINLLTSAFATNLADALQRSLTEQIEFLPAPHAEALFSAQAG